MDNEHTSSLEFSEIDLLKIYNSVPRTLSRSVIVVSVLLDNRGKNDRATLKQETSGNYWIIKINNTNGWLLPKGGQRIDKYQYQTLESLFECQGYEPEGTRKFTINKIARVSFDFDKDKWFLEDKGVLKFGNSSIFFELEATQQECETLAAELEQFRQENKQLEVELKRSKANIEQLKIQLDLSLKLQEAKNYQVEINGKLESFKKSILNEISDRVPQHPNINLESLKKEIINEISDRDIKFDNKLESLKEKLLGETSDRDIKFDNKLESLKEKLLDEIGDRIPKQPNIDLEFFKESIIKEISDRIPSQPNSDLQAFKEAILNEIGDRIPQQPNINLESFKEEIVKEISDRIPQQPNIDNEISDIHQKQFHNKLETFNKSTRNEISEGINSKIFISDIVERYNSDDSFFPEKEILVSISTGKKDHKGNNLAVNDARGNCWIIRNNDLSFLIPKKDYKFNTYQFTTLQHFFDFKKYKTNQTRKFALEEPAKVSFEGKYWRLKRKGVLNFGTDAADYSLVELAKDNKFFTQQSIPISSNLDNLQSLMKIYNSNPRQLASNITTVAATRESVAKRRSGNKTPIIFIESSQDSFWIVQELSLQDDCFYLVPSANLTINERIYMTISYIFVCQNYANRSSNKFSLSKPAIVKFNRDWENEWELVEPGEIIFP
ncbi:MAG: hypothetical protein QNJ55_31635 [Xenococcus sp. MO_188.B8]|nr:hypothetical protein [Xenococcus sp. MO_188.B8]